VSDRKPCRNPVCDQSVSMNGGMDFCFNCSAMLVRDAAELAIDLSKVLRLEAEFRAWCLDHGQPDPHD
jgi:hypothetical protein